MAERSRTPSARPLPIEESHPPPPQSIGWSSHSRSEPRAWRLSDGAGAGMGRGEADRRRKRRSWGILGAKDWPSSLPLPLWTTPGPAIQFGSGPLPAFSGFHLKRVFFRLRFRLYNLPIRVCSQGPQAPLYALTPLTCNRCRWGVRYANLWKCASEARSRWGVRYTPNHSIHSQTWKTPGAEVSDGATGSAGTERTARRAEAQAPLPASRSRGRSTCLNKLKCRRPPVVSAGCLFPMIPLTRFSFQIRSE